MVMGPGGYTTMDFLKFGTPMQIVLMFASVAFLVSSLWLSWLLAALVFGIAVVFAATMELRKFQIASKVR